ncbi:UDP-Gal betaGal beta 1,3-galactosyltransferase, polypeptide 6 [Mortierella sp. NVP85]|nr:UDP-Gal betaGal beta 1,3-galactosyltransferase, polypeptide 6 [Mortierella sp. NVP85]
MFWAYLLTTAIVQRLLQSYRPPNTALRVALAHLCSWIVIGISVNSSPFTEPIRPWVYITLAQSVLLFVIVYLPWFRAQVQPAGFSKQSDRSPHHALDDGFMGREISGQSATRFIALPLMIVGLCSWMLIITRDHQNPSGGLIQDVLQSPAGQSFNNGTGTFLENIDRQVDNRMVISMIVLSSATPQGFVNRKMFRETTLKLFPSPRNKAVIVKYRFIIGTTMPAVEQELQQEHKVTGDLLIVTAPDRGDSKSRKLYKAIEWANQFDFDYLVKTDDDVLVRMDALSGELYKQGKKEYFWKGLVFKNVPNTRLDDLDLKEMPAFTDGTLTTLSRDIVRLLSIPAPRYFVSSSAQSLGIWLHGYGIKPVHDTRIQPGAFVCEEDLIAKHFDNEPSLLVHPRDDPVKMVERINLIRGELKQNKGNRNFRTSISICDPLIQKRCAMCYSCQGRASNWKQMGFDCKQGGVVVGDKYRKPELLNSKQMDELLNRPSGGVLEELGPIYLKDYRPESRARQQMNREMQEEDPEEVTEEGGEEQEEAPEEEERGEVPEVIMSLEDALEDTEVQEQQIPEQMLERSLGGRGEKSSRTNLKAFQKPKTSKTSKTSKKKPRHLV